MFGWLGRKDVSVATLEAIDNGGLSSEFDVRMPVKQALMVMAVFAAVRVISEDVAKLPAKLKRKVGDSSVTAEGEPEHVILSRVGKPATGEDDGFTAMEWIEAIVAAAAIDGVGVAWLNRVGGRAREVTPIPRGSWREVNGRWEILWKSGWAPVDRGELMVLRGPQLGLNVTRQARRAIDLASKLDQMMTSLARKAGRPNGIISVEQLGSVDRAKALIQRIKEYFGPSGEGGVMALDLGSLHYQRLSLTPEELQQNETYRRAVTQIASAYRVQPARLMHEITDHNNASAYTWNIIHVQDCIQPWTKRFRQTFDKDVLGPELVSKGYYCDVSLQGLLQGAPEERGKLYMALRTVGAMSPLTIAQLEDLPTDGVSDDPAFPLLTNPNPAKENGGQNGKN